MTDRWTKEYMSECFEYKNGELYWKKKVFRFRNYLRIGNKVAVTRLEEAHFDRRFVRWLGDWQEVEVDDE